MTKKKPTRCPYCGLPAEVRRYWSNFAVECSQFDYARKVKLCFERTLALGATRAEAITAWNRREFYPHWRKIA